MNSGKPHRQKNPKPVLAGVRQYRNNLRLYFGVDPVLIAIPAGPALLAWHYRWPTVPLHVFAIMAVAVLTGFVGHVGVYRITCRRVRDLKQRVR